MAPKLASLSSHSRHRNRGWLPPTIGGLAFCFVLGLGCGGTGQGGGTGGSQQSSWGE